MKPIRLPFLNAGLLLAGLLLPGLLLAGGLQAAAADHVHASDAWIRVLPGALPAGAYVTLHNDSAQPVALTGATSTAYAEVMLHHSSTAGGMSRMSMVDTLTVPVHGEAAHLEAHAALGRQHGIPNVVHARNGDMIRLFPEVTQFPGEVRTGELYLDGNVLCTPEESGVKGRRRLSFGGHIVVSVVVDSRGGIVSGPDFSIEGLPEVEDDDESLTRLVRNTINGALKSIPPKRRADPDVVDSALEKGPWILGENFSAADIVIGSGLNFSVRLFKMIQTRPAFDRYLDRCAGRPAFQRAAALAMG